SAERGGAAGTDRREEDLRGAEVRGVPQNAQRELILGIDCELRTWSRGRVRGEIRGWCGVTVAAALEACRRPREERVTSAGILRVIADLYLVVVSLVRPFLERRLCGWRLRTGLSARA